MNLPIGNVRETPFSEIWANSPIFTELRTLNYKGGCGTCKYKHACGGCRARAAFYCDGDYMAEEPWCLYNERMG
jgi:radical SAM protein with 4Fe4S-binding SPASM domain